MAVQGERLAKATALPYDDPRRDQLIDQALAEVPDDLIAELTQEAAGHLWLKGQRPL